MNFILSGGHLTPLIAFIDYLQKKSDKVLLVVGNESTSSIEQNEIKNRGIGYLQIRKTRFDRYRPISIFSNLLNLFTQTHQLYQTLKPIIKLNPNLKIINFGSGASLPLGLVSIINHLPIYLHEQTSVMGLANRILSPFASKIAISYKNTKYAPSRAIVTGNLLRPEIISPPQLSPFAPSDKPILYVTGGHLGAESLNRIIEKHLGDLLSRYVVFWQYGNSTWVSQYHHQCQVKNWYSAPEAAWLIKHASLVITRAGANTISELIYHQTPAIVVPLPSSANNEQDLNADIIVKSGRAIKLVQNNFDSQLLDSINQVNKLSPLTPLAVSDGTPYFYKLIHD